MILIIFAILITSVWVWFFKNEIALCENLYKPAQESFEAGEYKTSKDYFQKLFLLIPVLRMQNIN